jgi:hypothetical protein
MASKKKTASGEQAELRPAPARHHPSPLVPLPSEGRGPTPARLEYTPAGATEKWQAQQFEALVLEFGLGDEAAGVPTLPWPDVMRDFHEFAEGSPQRWFLVRRLYGVVPLIPRPDSSVDDLRTHSREEVGAAMNLKPDQLDDELAQIRAAWHEFLRQRERSMGGGGGAQGGTGAPWDARGRAAADPEPPLGDALLERFGFSKKMFEDVQVLEWDEVSGQKVNRKRAPEESRKDMEWFIHRLMRPEWQKMLEEPMAGQLARTTLVNELYLHRFDAEMFSLMPNTPEWKAMSKSREEISKQYEGQMESLEDKFPELGVKNRTKSQFHVSDMNLAHRQYYGHKDNRLIDGVFTRMEIEFMMRSSAQMPMPRYRLSWQLMAAEARHGTFDPNFRSKLDRKILRRLDKGWQRGIDEARGEETGSEAREVNLENGVMPGEAGTDEYPDFQPAPA